MLSKLDKVFLLQNVTGIHICDAVSMLLYPKNEDEDNTRCAL